MLREGRGGRLSQRRQGLAAMSSAALEQTAKALPSEEQVDSATPLEQLRSQEAAILEKRRRHEEALARLQARYQKVRQKMYRDHKKAVISSDNAKLTRFQGGCAKPKKLAGLTKAEADEQARCLQTEGNTVDDSDLGRMMRQHLWQQPAPLPTGQCHSFRSIATAQLKLAQQECLLKVGDAKWSVEGLVDADESKRTQCGRKWMGTAETRCLLAGHDLLFIGNSVVRRQMYAMLDLLSGPSAHRQLPDFTSVALPSFKSTPDAERRIKRSWIWDQDNATYGYHAAQLFTIDLATGEHRFSKPHREHCGVDESHASFNAGRLNQWLYPGSGEGGTTELTKAWPATKWAKREWQPLISFQLEWNANELAPPDTCTPRQLSWAGAHASGVRAAPDLPVAAAPPSRLRRGRRATREGLAARVRTRLLQEVEKHFASTPGAAEWLSNVSVHVEQPLSPHPTTETSGGGSGGSEGEGDAYRASPSGPGVAALRPNVWLYFPTYHGERETFNGFCEDKPCTCTGAVAQCARHPECQVPVRSGNPKHVCAPLARGSEAFVDHARDFAAMLRGRGKLLGHTLRRIKVTPFYDDCWAHRGRCQGHRPCQEPVDAAWTCRATAMYCPAGGPSGWPGVLAKAKAWVPPGHPRASMLYLFDGATFDLIDETFRTWGTHTVGYGSSTLIFGPQFGNFHGAAAWRDSFALIKNALRRADACVGRRTQLLFRSPGFNFDPANSPQNQAAFSASMRPIVEEYGMVYVDNYPATYDAVFQSTPHAIKFAKNSAFHYLNAGRYLMAQLVLHALKQLAPASAPG